MNEKIIDKLKKIKELATHGSEGEREAATKLFNEMVEKYHLEEYNFDDESIYEYTFRFHGKFEKRLLAQIKFKVTNDPFMSSLVNVKTGRMLRTAVCIKCTEAQSIEIEFLFEFYKKLFYEEQELFFNAFIQKHRLFGQSDEVGDSNFDADEIRRMFGMMKGLKDDNPLRQIGDGTQQQPTPKKVNQ